MSPVARRQLWVVLVAAMLALAAVTLVLVLVGREDAWIVVGGALTVAIGALDQLLTLARTGERLAVTARGLLLLVSLSLAAAAALVTAGVTDESAFTWLIAAIFLVGLAFTVVGALLQARRPPP